MGDTGPISKRDALTRIENAKLNREFAESALEDAIRELRDSLAIAKMVGAKTSEMVAASGLSAQRVRRACQHVRRGGLL